MSSVATTRKVLAEMPNFITEVLRRERLQRCQVAPGAEERILAATIAAIDAEVTCRTD